MVTNPADLKPLTRYYKPVVVWDAAPLAEEFVYVGRVETDKEPAHCFFRAPLKTTTQATLRPSALFRDLDAFQHHFPDGLFETEADAEKRAASILRFRYESKLAALDDAEKAATSNF